MSGVVGYERTMMVNLSLLLIFITAVLLFFMYRRKKKNVLTYTWTLFLIGNLLNLIGTLGIAFYPESYTKGSIFYSIVCIGVFFMFTMIATFGLFFTYPLLFKRNKRFTLTTLAFIFIPRLFFLLTSIKIVVEADPAQAVLEVPLDMDYFNHLTLDNKITFMASFIHMFILMCTGFILILYRFLNPRYIRTTQEFRSRVSFIVAFFLALILLFWTLFLFKIDVEYFAIFMIPISVLFTYILHVSEFFFIEPVTENGHVMQGQVSVEHGKVVILPPQQAYKRFQEGVKKGSEGLYITGKRPNPDIMRFKKTPVIILDGPKDKSSNGNVRELGLADSSEFIANLTHFINNAKNGLILVDDIGEMAGKDPRGKDLLSRSVQTLRTTLKRSKCGVILAVPGIKKSGIVVNSNLDIPSINRISLEKALNELLTKDVASGAKIKDAIEHSAHFFPMAKHIQVNDRGVHIPHKRGKDHLYTSIQSHMLLGALLNKIKTQMPKSHQKQALEIIKRNGFDQNMLTYQFGTTNILISGTDTGFQVLRAFTERGYPALVLGRESPKRTIQRHMLDTSVTRVIWITDIRNAPDNAVPPKLENINAELEDFLDSSSPGVILISGLEYLMTYAPNMKDPVLKSIQRIADWVAVNNSILLIPLDRSILEKRDIALLKGSGIEIHESPDLLNIGRISN